jgi:hypothetical protein
MVMEHETTKQITDKIEEIAKNYLDTEDSTKLLSQLGNFVFECVSV